MRGRAARARLKEHACGVTREHTEHSSGEHKRRRQQGAAQQSRVSRRGTPTPELSAEHGDKHGSDTTTCKGEMSGTRTDARRTRAQHDIVSPRQCRGVQTKGDRKSNAHYRGTRREGDTMPSCAFWPAHCPAPLPPLRICPAPPAPGPRMCLCSHCSTSPQPLHRLSIA